MNTLTEKQKEVLEFIQRSIETRGYPPSHREICKHFGWSGPRSAAKHLIALIRKGYLRKGAGARALEVISRGSKTKGKEPSPLGREIPILGKVAAGLPILAQEHRLGSLVVDPSLVRWKDAYLLKVRGESMRDAGILDGDLVLVRPQSDADAGDIVVALVGEEATVKRLIKKRGAVLLMPENPAFEPIPITPDSPAQIIGKVSGVFRI